MGPRLQEDEVAGEMVAPVNQRMKALVIVRFQNRSDRNHIPDRGCNSQNQSQFNYHDQISHHGWDTRYAGGTYVPRQTYGPTIPAVEPLHQPQPVGYCKICEVKLGNYKMWKHIIMERNIKEC